METIISHPYVILLAWLILGAITAMIAWGDGQFAAHIGKDGKKVAGIPFTVGLIICCILMPLAVVLTGSDFVKNRRMAHAAAKAATATIPQVKGAHRMKKSIATLALGAILATIPTWIPWDRVHDYLFPPPPPPSALLKRLDALLSNPDLWKFKSNSKPVDGGLLLETEGIKLTNIDSWEDFRIRVGGQDVTILLSDMEKYDLRGKARETVRSMLAADVMAHMPSDDELTAFKK